MVFHRCLSDSKSPQISRTLLSILADLKKFRWSPLVLLFPSPPVPLSILWWLYLSCQLQLVSPSLSSSVVFFSSLARSRYLSLFPLSFSSTLRSVGMAKSTIWQVPFFCWQSLGLVVWPRLNDSFVFQNPKEFCVSHFLVCEYTILFVLSNLNFLHISQWIIFPTQSFSALLLVSHNLSPGFYLRPRVRKDSDYLYSMQ